MSESLRRAIGAEPLFFLVTAAAVALWALRLGAVPGAFLGSVCRAARRKAPVLDEVIGASRAGRIRRIAAACQACGARTGLWDCRACALGVAFSARAVLGVDLPVRLGARRGASAWDLHLYVDGLDAVSAPRWDRFVGC